MTSVNAAVRRLVRRLQEEVDAMEDVAGSVPAAEVAALLRLLEAQARGVLQACEMETPPDALRVRLEVRP